MATYLEYAFPIPVAASPGSAVDIETFLGVAFGPDYGGYPNFLVAYYGPAQLHAWDFSYWNVNAPSVARWFVNAEDIGGGFNNQANVPLSQLASVDFHAGNDIGPLAFITVPIAGSPGNWTEYIQYALITVAPSLISATAANGAPAPADILAAVQRFAAAYVDVPNDNDCHHIAEAVAAAAGATLPYLSYSTNPAENQEGGFWRTAYLGSDPNPVANWQSLVQPGDIVRMGWQGGGFHTTLVLSTNPDGSLQVYDNIAYDQDGTEIIGIHTANYDQQTIATTITIYRLTSDHLYLTNGTSVSESLHGTLYSDLIAGNGGADAMAGWIGDDAYVVDSVSDVVTENANEGTDTVRASISYALPANVEQLYLMEAAGAATGVGNGEQNLIVGNSFDNALDGSSNNDQLEGGGGNDTLFGGTGTDGMIGGTGNDTYFVDSVFDLIVENASEGIDTVYTNSDYIVGTNVEQLYLQESAGTAAGVGNGEQNLLVGNSFDNALDGGSNNDQLEGGGGNDTLEGGAGTDGMIGGAGNDTYFVDSIFDVIVENAGEGIDTVYASSNYIIGANVEQLYLQESAGTATGVGNGEQNLLIGNSFANALDGGSNNDTLRGGGGDDTLFGGTGIDGLYGEAGNDHFVFNPGTAAGDVMVDFAGNGAAAGDHLSFVGFGAGATFTQQDATHWVLTYNGGANTEVITFQNAATIDATDFQFL